MADVRQHKNNFTFIVAGVAIAIIIIGVAGSLLTTIDQQLRSDAKLQVKALTEQAASNAADHIRLIENAIEAFAVQSSDLNEIQPSLFELKQAFGFSEVAFVDGKGKGCRADGAEFSEDDISTNRIVREENGVTYRFPHLNVRDEYVYQASTKISIKGDMVGTLYVDVPINMLISEKEFSIYGGKGYFIIFEAETGLIFMLPTEVNKTSLDEGLSLYSFLDSAQGIKEGEQASDDLAKALEESTSEKSQENIEQLQQAAENGLSELVPAIIDGESYYISVEPIDMGGLYVCSLIPESNLRSETSSINTAFVFVFGIILLCLLAVLFMFSFFYRKRMGDRNLEMKTHLYGALSDSLDMSVNMYSPEDGTITPIVAKTREIMGYSMAEFIGNKRIAERIELSESGRDLLKRLVDGDIASLERGEFSFKNKRTKEQRWVVFSVNPFYYENKRQLLIVFRDSTNAKSLELSMKDAMVAAEAANHAKSDFLSRMSHEIRTPMNAIIGMAQIAQKHLDDTERVEVSLKKINLASDHLLGLINDVLDISKIESGKMMLMPEKFNIFDLIESVSLVIIAQCEQRKQTFEVFKEGIVEEEFVGDRVRLQQVLVNLLTNSVKYTPNEGHISLSIKQRKIPVKNYVEMCFVIKDNGIGMTEEYQKHIFEPFVMEGRTASQGTGLGMPIVKNILTMMNGDIQVESVVDKGTTFTVIINLECASDDVPIEASRTYEEAYDDSEIKSDVPPHWNEVTRSGSTAAKIDGDGEVLESTAATAENGSLVELASDQEIQTDSDSDTEIDFTKLCILLAEDNDLNAEIASELLSDVGLEVEWAKDGEEACTMFEDSSSGYYDLILMDIQMPNLNGYEATERIRALNREDAKRIPIVAMSANAFAEDVQTSLRSGMNAHLSKPIDIHLVIETIAEQIRKTS